MMICTRCGCSSITMDYDRERGTYPKCLMCGCDKLKEVERSENLRSLSNQSKIIPKIIPSLVTNVKKEGASMRGTRYDQAFKDSCVADAEEIEREKGQFLWGDAEKIGKERGCAGVSVWQWWKKKHADAVESLKEATRTVEENPEQEVQQALTERQIKESSEGEIARAAVKTLIAGYSDTIAKCQEKIKALESVLQDLAA